MFIEAVTGCTDELYEAIQILIPQLGPDKPIPARSVIESLIQSESSTLLIARHPGKGDPIAGILTLAIYRVPTGLRSIVEDVIVDEKYRRRGIAEALLSKAIKVARKPGQETSLFPQIHRGKRLIGCIKKWASPAAMGFSTYSASNRSAA